MKIRITISQSTIYCCFHHWYFINNDKLKKILRNLDHSSGKRTVNNFTDCPKSHKIGNFCLPSPSQNRKAYNFSPTDLANSVCICIFRCYARTQLYFRHGNCKSGNNPFHRNSSHTDSGSTLPRIRVSKYTSLNFGYHEFSSNPKIQFQQLKTHHFADCSRHRWDTCTSPCSQRHSTHLCRAVRTKCHPSLY